MPKRGAGDAASRQVLVRLTDAQFEVLSALAYLRGVTSTEIARGEVASLLDRAKSDDRIQRLIRERREFEAEEAGQLRTLPTAAERTTDPA